MKHVFLLVFLFYLIGPADSREDTQPEPDSQYMAKLIYLSDQVKTPYPDLYRINPKLPENLLYVVQKQYVGIKRSKGSVIAGFKGGFTSTQPIGGVLFADGLISTGETIKKADYVNLVIEAEIGFRFCTHVKEQLENTLELQEAVCELIPALEVADARLSNFDDIRKSFSHLRSTLIPLNILSKQFVLGAPISPTQIDLLDLEVTTSISQKRIGSQHLSEKADIWANVLWVVNNFIVKEGYSLSPGQIVLPGNLTGIHAGHTGSWKADFGQLGSVEIEVE